jgi:ankyrin repeat protein
VALELLTAGAEIGVGDAIGQTPLHTAVGQDHADVVGLLLGFGADPNAQTSLAGLTPLHLAKTAAVVDQLAEAGATINARDQEGRTPLHLAAGRGLAPVVAALLRHGARVDAATTPGGWMALHWAATGEVAQLLLQAGTDPNALDSASATPLHWAASGGRVDVIGVLLEGGGSTEARDGEGKTPLWWAVSSSQKSAAAKLLAASGDVRP